MLYPVVSCILCIAQSMTISLIDDDLPSHSNCKSNSSWLKEENEKTTRFWAFWPIASEPLSHPINKHEDG